MSAEWGGDMPQASMAGGGKGAEPLVRAVQTKLYDRCYARRSDNQGTTPTQSPVSSQLSDPDFARRLVAANAGRERWDKGWAIHQFGPNGQAFVRKGDRERVAMPGPSFLMEYRAWRRKSARPSVCACHTTRSMS